MTLLLFTFFTPLSLHPTKAQMSSTALNTITLRSFLNVGHKALQPCKTTKIDFPCVLIFVFLDSKLEGKNSTPNDCKHSLTSICS